MKTIIKNLCFVLGLVFTLVFTSCSKEDDEVKDLVKPTAIISQPIDGTIFHRGSSIIFEGDLIDDIALATCEFSLTTLKGWDIPWEPGTDVVKLSGSKQKVSAYQVFQNTIPMDIMSGSYVINIRVEDESGNYSLYPVNIEID